MEINNLVEQINKHVVLDEESKNVLSKHFISIDVNGKDFLLRGNEICKSFYFVNKGCLRMFFYDTKGKEQITGFAIEGWWMTDYMSFFQKISSDYYIQAVENSEVLSINHQSYESLLKEAPLLERYFRIIAQRGLGAVQVREKLELSLTKEDLYLHFSSSFPGFVQRVPQYMLASFLGITPEYLSEIRKKCR